ncbi:MAG: hypothetical protein AMXMBFR58_07160 [Phycisphaerae bacterium]|nr:STAS domain-containing protein [Phycisphaerales bacterium]
MATQWSDSIVVAELEDEPALSDELSALFDRTSKLGPDKVPNMVLNFGRVTYISSSNLAQLLRLRKRLTEANKQIRICCISDEVWSVLLVTGLDKVFRFSPDVMTALAGLQLESERSAKG